MTLKELIESAQASKTPDMLDAELCVVVSTNADLVATIKPVKTILLRGTIGPSNLNTPKWKAYVVLGEKDWVEHDPTADLNQPQI